MKKFLFTLVTVLVNIYAWAASLNPYAYNLRGTYNQDRQELTVSFTLNAHPNLDQTKGGTGIQIFAVDPNNHNERYYIHGVAKSDIEAHIKAGNYQYTYTFHVPSRELDGERRLLPTDKNLTWAVRVQGENTQNGSPRLVNEGLSSEKRPYSGHGIAVNKCQNSADFGLVYVTEPTNGLSTQTYWSWLSSEGKSLLQFDPTLKFKRSYKNSSFNGIATTSESNINLKSPNTKQKLSPHRVRISDDGRIFVSSYDSRTVNDVAVWELNPSTNAYTPIIRHNNTQEIYKSGEGYYAVYGDRAIGMDVKGSGDNLTLLVCFLDEWNVGTTVYANSFQIYEYSVNGSTATLIGDPTKNCRRYRPEGDGDVSGTAQKVLEDARCNNWYFYSNGFANVAYGAKNDKDVFFAVDFHDGNSHNNYLMCFKNGGTTASTPLHHVNTSDHYYGAAGFLTYLDNGNEYIVSGRSKDISIDANVQKPNYGRIHVYPFNSNTGVISETPRSNYSLTNVETQTVINDMAMDPANNIYAVSARINEGAQKGTGRIVAIAMPYNGQTITVAPNKAIAATNTEPAHQASFRLTPLALSHEDTNLAAKLQNQTATVEVTRPLQSESFNTICLPFALTTLTGTPYEGASVKKFVGVTYSNESEEELLYLSFEDVTFTGDDYMYAGTPYLILPNGDIHAAVRFYDVTLSATIKPIDYEDVNFIGVLAKQALDAGKLIVVANNQLAENTGGEINGLRAYFTLNQTKNVKAKLSFRRPTATDIDNISTKDIDVEKFLREGRVYIRMGEELYTINGEKVE